jgi:hypothetical protein
VFRQVNEQIDHLQHRFATVADGRLDIVCECDRIGCSDPLEVAAETYERVRQDPASFFVRPGHEDPSVETVVERGADFLVVRKHAGEPRQIAEDTDPRR